MSVSRDQVGSLRGRLLQSIPFLLFPLSSQEVHLSFSHNHHYCITKAFGPPGTSCLILLSNSCSISQTLFLYQLLSPRYSVVAIKKNDPSNSKNTKANAKPSQTWPLNMIHCRFFVLRNPLLLGIFSICFNKITIIFYYWISSCDFSGSPKWYNTVVPHSYLVSTQSSHIFRFILTI